MKVSGVPSAGLTKMTSLGSRRGGVDGEDYEGMFEDFGVAVDGVSFEEDEFTGADFEGRRVAEEERGAAGEDEEVFVAGGVVVGGRGGVDAEDAGAGCGLVDEAGVEEHGGCGGREVARDGGEIEDGGGWGRGVGHDGFIGACLLAGVNRYGLGSVA
jgi:hypothetical protein